MMNDGKQDNRLESAKALQEWLALPPAPTATGRGRRDVRHDRRNATLSGVAPKSIGRFGIVFKSDYVATQILRNESVFPRVCAHVEYSFAPFERGAKEIRLEFSILR